MDVRTVLLLRFDRGCKEVFLVGEMVYICNLGDSCNIYLDMDCSEKVDKHLRPDCLVRYILVPVIYHTLRNAYRLKPCSGVTLEKVIRHSGETLIPPLS